ncbi:MAG: chromosome segregation protein SMC [Clostridia bacterium]|nr:chromosome segregation protein SMC [Clostridia bacterium]
MHLKKLELQGFKSFPEYTLIEFDKGMTAVVGPNGSGKSNVTDAIRWVLGEQSVKSLRGGKMEDVIFTGTQSRKPMNYAEVTMTLDNSDHFVNYEFDEIQVTRRLYRSGESEYQINKVNCRLKDVIALFLDTGLGKDGYSIVGQGRVDEILSTKSEDRRRVLEEASGIVKYKVKKDEAERKLNSTEQNLIRINDQISSLEERIEPLRIQSEQAIKYHKLYDELKENDIALMLHKINNASLAMGDSGDVKLKLEEDLKTNEDLFIKIREENRALNEKVESLDELIEQKRQDMSDISEEAHDIKVELGASTAKEKYLTERKEAIQSEKAALASKIEEFNREYAENDSKANSILDELREEEKKAEKLNEELRILTEEFSKASASQNEVKQNIENKTSELINTRERINILDTKIQSSNEQLSELMKQKNNGNNSVEDLKKELETSDKYFHDMMTQVGNVTSDINDREVILKDINKRFLELNKDYEENNRKLIAGNSKLKLLIDNEKAKEGYQESVRRLIRETEGTSNAKKIVGILGDLISTDSKYDIAIEIALGNSIHNVVTETEQDASDLINVLKNGHMGRVTFLPIENIRPREIEYDFVSKAKRINGYIGIASDLVENDRDIDDIVSNLLGRIFICNDMNSARQIAASTKHQIKVITLDGDSINPGGSLTGGSVRKNNAGILGRGREIEELKTICDTLEQKLAISETERQEIDDQKRDIEKEVLQLEEQLKYFTMERVKAETQYNNDKSRLSALVDSLNNINETIESVSKQRLEYIDDKEESSLVVGEIENELSDYREVITKGDTKNKASIDKMDKLKEEINDSKLVMERLIAARNGIMELTGVISREKKNFEENLNDKNNEISEIEQELKSILSEREVNSGKIAEFNKVLSEMQEEVNKLNKERDELDSSVETFVDRITGLQDTINSIRNELNNLTIKYEKYINEIDNCKNHLWEEYELAYGNIDGTKFPEITDEAKTGRLVSSLKTQIRNIGPVNLNSIDEYKQVSDEFNFKSEQRDDIVNSKNDLEKVIADLVEEMKKQFISNFNTINQNFKTVFEDLFNGGTAEIVLDNEEDVLNCGIEIKAQPPGKKLQSLTLLSGGERCLTAIALLFGILQLSPSPFVVLDEVEAALDEVNVTRFADFVRRYTTRSQFILVTHRKGTMEACDRMYGVTMQERGISKILSMRLGDNN